MHWSERLPTPEVFEGFRFPFIEDVVNAPPFTSYLEWREDRGKCADGPLPPKVLHKVHAVISRYGTGAQQAAFSGKAALPPVVTLD